METTAPYGYGLLRCQNFDEVLSRDGQACSLDDIENIARRSGRLLLQAPGGSGKSFTLKRLVNRIELRAGSGSAVAVFLGDFTFTSDVDMRLVDIVPGLQMHLDNQDKVLILLDGLNEIDRDLASPLLDEVDTFANQNPQISVIVTDRLTRRHINPRRWSLATLSRVPKESIRKLVNHTVSDTEYDLLSSPAYLERAVLNGIFSATRSQSHYEEFVRSGIEDHAFELLTELALSAYKSHSSRVLQLEMVYTAIKKKELDKLLSSGILVRIENSAVRFQHHLQHDYLAARAAASKPESWHASLFDALSFRRSGFDCLALLLEQSDPEYADQLIVAIYDWDLYAAAYLLGDDVATSQKITPRIQTAILSLMGERRFDIFRETATRVSDALRVHESRLASKLLAARSPAEVQQIAAEQHASDSEYQTWLRLFTAQNFDSDLKAALLADDGINGWTAANSAKRTAEVSDLNFLLSSAQSEVPVVRWRAVHALGAIAHNKSGEALFERLSSDPDPNVRYGSLRSIVEIAALAADPIFRSKLLLMLSESVDILLNWPRLSDEFSRVVHIIKGSEPENWYADLSPVIENLLKESDTIEEQDRWRTLSAQLRLNWTPRT